MVDKSAVYWLHVLYRQWVLSLLRRTLRRSVQMVQTMNSHTYLFGHVKQLACLRCPGAMWWVFRSTNIRDFVNGCPLCGYGDEFYMRFYARYTE